MQLVLIILGMIKTLFFPPLLRCVQCYRRGFASEGVGLFEKPGLAQDPHKGGKLLRGQLIVGDFHLVAEFPEEGLLGTFQRHGLLEFGLDFLQRRLRIGSGTVGGMRLS